METFNQVFPQNRTNTRKHTNKSQLLSHGSQLLPFLLHETFGFLTDNSVIYPVPALVLPHVALTQKSSRFPGGTSVVGWLIVFARENYTLQSQNFSQDVALLQTPVIIPGENIKIQSPMAN